MRPLLALLPLSLAAQFAYASCGSTFCAVNSNWDTQGLSNDAGLLVDLRYSYSKADQWRAGASRSTLATPSGSGEEIENKRTINQLLNLNVDYALNKQWAVMLGLPYVARDHQHTLDAAPDPVLQQAKFTEIGDLRIQAKYKFDGFGRFAGSGVRFGLKLPTGATNQTMTPADPNDPATPYKLERASQAGTGSTDGILGLYYFRNSPGNDLGWFVSGQYQSALATKDNYRPGNEVTLDTGMHYEAFAGVNLLLQLNAQYRKRDSGSEANPASGGYSVNLAPGASYALDSGTQIYGFVQLPLIRYVNTDPADSASGQLATRAAFSLGLTHRF